MIVIKRSLPADPVFHSLVAELDAGLRTLYGAKQSEYDVLNAIPEGAKVVIAVDGDRPVGCGCFKSLGQSATVELKRMYVQTTSRRMGIARLLLTELEGWAKEEGYAAARLQTAVKQPEAIALYEKCGYRHISNYGAYIGDENSVCMEKQL